MLETIKNNKYERKVTPLERMFTRSPYAIVTMVARIKGNISENMLKDAVSKIQLRHTNLRVRIHEDKNHIPRFTSEGVKEIPIDIMTRESDDHWMKVFHEACKMPFDFEERPPIRFILVQSPQMSELIILCHHIICDGVSLAYLARDLMIHLGDPTREVEVLPDPIPIDRDNLPKEVSINPIVKYFINRMNKKWIKNQIFFDHEDYRVLNEAYWKKYRHEMVSVELSEAQTSAIIDRCRKEDVSVNTALTTAFIAAQYLIRRDIPNYSGIIIAGNMRERLPSPAGETMGYFAGGVTLKYKYNKKISFWENVRKLHQKVQPLYTNKNLFKEPLSWCYLEPAIMESLSFKILGGIVPEDSSRYHKISTFSEQDDVVSSVLKRGNIDTLDNPSLGIAVSNLTRLDFPKMYGSLELDRLIFNPGAGFPLTTVNFNLGAITCAGKLSLLVEYSEVIVDTETIEKIKEKALEFLLKD